MSASKISRTENVSSVHDNGASPIDIKQQNAIDNYRAVIEGNLYHTRKLVALGDEFLAFVSQPEVDGSVAKFLVEKCDSLINDNWFDDAALAIEKYIREEKGSGKCYQWLHGKLQGIAIGNYYRDTTAFGDACIFECVMLLLRYVRPTPTTIEVAQKIVQALKDDANADKNKRALYKHIVYDVLAKQLFATLDDDPFWDAHPLNK